MAIGIEATFLLGTYTGHRADKSRDQFPGLARLHAALLNAAGQGCTAIVGKSGLAPTEEAVAALEWLEQNPPTGIRLPRMFPVATTPIIAYRNEGVIRKEGGAWKDKVTGRAFCDGYAFDGPVGWCWRDGIPDGVRAVLESLCPDVSCLGEAASPVRLAVTDIEPTHHLDPEASIFDTGGIEVPAPASGRTAALSRAHSEAYGRSPSITEDRHTATEGPSPSLPAADAVDVLRYRPDVTQPEDVPWPAVVLLTTPLSVRPEHRVRWCTALHRALIARIGFGAPALITGTYGSGIRQPANRLAIQYLPAGMVAQHGIGSAAFALLIPREAASEDLETLYVALQGMRGFSSSGGRAEVAEVIMVDGAHFWPAPLPGSVRRWVTNPVAVPETSPQRRRRNRDGNSRRWALSDAVRVSIGLVWRDTVAGQRTSSRWFEQIADRTIDYGVEVHDVRVLHSSNVSSWVHKVPKQIIVQPYHALLSLGALATDRTVIAIGQSRHLGGGLLVPVDSPADTFPGLPDPLR